MFMQYLTANLTILFLIVGFALKLFMRKGVGDTQMRYFYITLLSVFLLTISDFLDEYLSVYVGLVNWRIFFAALGYTLRPVACLSLVLMVWGKKEYKIWFWIPAIINGLLAFSAFFTKIYFYFDLFPGIGSSFHRGPLGSLGFIVSGLYLLLLLYVTFVKFRAGRRNELIFLIFCAVGCYTAALFDSLISWDAHNLNAFIVISSVFYYMFIVQQDADLDALTGLRNRQAYYTDIQTIEPQVTAVASIDMNGLKELNDSSGHDAGDKALKTIANAMKKQSTQRIIPYRVGGDEFMILYVKTDEITVQKTINGICEDVTAAGYSVAAGYAMRSSDEKLDDMVILSDARMYREKNRYYQEAGIDRRPR